MKRIITFTFVLSCLFFSCTKERLVIVEKELQFDENSYEYQVYQAERAMQYIRTYRFEKLGDVLNKINDEVLKKSLQDSLKVYRQVAENNALFFVKDKKDTLFYFPAPNNNPTYKDEVVLGGSFRIGANLTMEDSRGVLNGLKNFPKTTMFRFYNTLATGIEGMELLPDLKKFEWVLEQYTFENEFPDTKFEPVPLKVNLSKNHKLEEIILSNIELGNIEYPVHQMNKIRAGGLVKSGNLDGLWAKHADIFGLEHGGDFVIKDSKIDELFLGNHVGIVVKSLDISSSDIKRLQTAPVEKVLLNESLENLSFDAGSLKEEISFPAGIRKMDLYNYLFTPDFSKLYSLDSLELGYSTDNSYSGAPNRLEFNLSDIHLPLSIKYIGLSTSGYYEFNADGIQFPPSLQSVRFSARIKNTLDLSYLTNLKELTLYTTYFSGEIKLPSAIEKLDFGTSSLLVSRLDLSNLTNIIYLNLGDLGKNYAVNEVHITTELVLPPNLSEQALINVTSRYMGVYYPVSLKKGSTIINKPSWFDKYVNYYD